MTTASVALHVDTDTEHGGRWTSLMGGGRQWLWHRTEPRRALARPGSAFVDAGGVEECIPTVRGTPDHGDAWSRPWRQIGNTAVVECQDFTLARRIREHRGAIICEYRLSARPGYRFIWAAHALLELSDSATLEAPTGTPTRIFPESAPHIRRNWPAGTPWLEGPWPAPEGFRLDCLGPDDGTAVGAVLRLGIHGSSAVRVVDSRDSLRMLLEVDSQPIAVALWRNLSGYPATSPYRSVGIEPMLGSTFCLAEAESSDAAVVPTTGEMSWRLTVTAEQTT